MLKNYCREKKKAQLRKEARIHLLTFVLTGVGFSSSLTPKFSCLHGGVR